MYKLIVSDMDGTLLNSKNEVSDYTKNVLDGLIDNNFHVAIATGRIYTSAKIYGKYLGIITPIIACNGAIVRDLNSDKIIYDSPMNKEDFEKVLSLCREHDLYFHFYTADTFYTEKLEKSSLKYSEWNKTLKEEEKIDMQFIENEMKIIKNFDDKVYKIQIISEDPEQLEWVRKELEKMDSIEISKSWYNNIEIMNKGVNKGHAVEELAQSLGVKQEEVICFGDNENDISMLSYAGMGVAMGNGEEIVKKAANYVTHSNDEDGVAKAIEKYVL